MKRRERNSGKDRDGAAASGGKTIFRKSAAASGAKGPGDDPEAGDAAVAEASGALNKSGHSDDNEGGGAKGGLGRLGRGRREPRNNADAAATNEAAKERPSYRLGLYSGGMGRKKGGSDDGGEGPVDDLGVPDAVPEDEEMGGVAAAALSPKQSAAVAAVAAAAPVPKKKTKTDLAAEAEEEKRKKAESYAIVKNIEKSAGTHRLNRIMKQTAVTTSRTANQVKMAKFERVQDPTNLFQVADFCSRVVLPPLRVDPHSIGGASLLGQSGQSPNVYPESIVQEALFVFRVASFESSTTGSGNPVDPTVLQYPAEYAKHKRSLVGLVGKAGGASRSSNKLRFIIMARSTNHPVIRPRKQILKTHNNGGSGDDKDDGDEDESEHDYDTMFAADLDDPSFANGENASQDSGPPKTTGAAQSKTSNPGSVFTTQASNTSSSDPQGEGGEKGEGTNGGATPGSEANQQQSTEGTAASTPTTNKHESKTSTTNITNMEEDEISSFPVMVCLTLNSDGTAPDIRKMCGLINLTTVQDLHSTIVQLAFNNGDTLRLDFGNITDDPHKNANSAGGGNAVAAAAAAATAAAKESGLNLDKERFVWTLLQIHAMLCCSVVERQAYQNSALWLPPLNVRNLDRAELQYLATVNGFLKESPVMRGLLERQRPYLEHDDDDEAEKKENDKNKNGSGTGDASDPKADMEEMDSLAYDLMMGNFHTRVTLFQSEEERKDAEEILNSTEWTRSLNKDESASAALSVAERLTSMLQGRMRELEAETCRRLIAWEDEKHFSANKVGNDAFTDADNRDTVDALALASLFKTLESLDSELADMEEWLQERAAAIKPLTDDCADIEEENRQLEQQWKSYDMLGSEMRRLLLGIELDETTEKVLKNPALALVYDEGGRVNVDASEKGVTDIHESGKKLQAAMDFPMRSGGLHLEAVSERAKGLDALANRFCTALAHIIVTVMEQFNEEVLASSDYGKVSKNDSHGMIAKKIRDTQRRFQSSLLGYIKLIEILAALSPDMLPALRDAYSEMVAESILMKKRMKGYFQALPGKNAAYMNKAGKDIKDYAPFYKKEGQVFETVNAPDIRNALAELLPVIAREAYFTSALFGSANKEIDGREKKRHFESTRTAVDNASQHFRYYIERTCGILPDQIGGKTTIENGVKGDPLLCLVGSVYLNEAMENYIDRDKKGGDHSLSLAYVRATILDLRKKADKQWVGWVDKQIEWIRTHDGVPLSGKRAGIFPSFARFPCYLDHVMLAASELREEGYTPDLVHIKVINYYMQKLASTMLESLKECAARETTDQQYAANVMQMENTYFLTQAIKQRGQVMTDLFAKQVAKANVICKESTDSYLGWMIKREFVTLHELFSRVSKLRKEVGDREVPTQVSKAFFVRTLQKEASREVMKEKIGVMFGRMEKHLSEDGGLLPVAWKALVKVMYEWFGRWEKMSTQIYGHRLSPSAVDIVRIAKAAGGAPVKKPPSGPSGQTTGSNGQGSEFGFKTILALGNKSAAGTVQSNPSI